MENFIFEHRIQYWSSDLSKENEEIAEIRSKLLNRMHTEPLTIEELHKLRSYLIAVQAIDTLLANDVEIQNSILLEKKTFIQKLFRK